MIKKILVYLLVILINLSIYRIGLTEAQEQTPDVLFFTQTDLDKDGDFDRADWRTYFNGISFQITVYDRDDDMNRSDTWDGAVDFDNDIWIFDKDSDGLIEINYQISC